MFPIVPPALLIIVKYTRNLKPQPQNSSFTSKTATNMPTSLHVRKVEGKPGSVYYPLETKSYELPQLKPSEVLIRMSAAALNHRDFFIRQHLYPKIDFRVPMCADGVGTVISTGSDPSAKAWNGKRVVMNPGTGWKDDPFGPEDPKGYSILGATSSNPNGTAVTHMALEASELEEAPEHLNDHEAAALPLAGLTAYRATLIKAREAMAPGKNVLITGIGGGVAIMSLLFAVGAGANVYVSSGSQEKIDKAVKMGAKGGINYKEKGWEKKLIGMLPNKKLDAIIDGAGGDIIGAGVQLLKAGGVISCYGMTVGPKMPFVMSAVLRNIEIRGSTMGSRKEFAEMIAFANEKKLRPIVSKVAVGLDNIADLDALFEEVRNGSQFGKLVIQIDGSASSSKL